jgi:protein SCO1/2
MRPGVAAWVFFAVVIFPAGARAQDRLPASLTQVGLDQRLNEQVPLDLEFRDEAGRSVRLGDYFAGRPVILVLAYYRCPMLCTQVLNGLVDGLRGIPLDAGSDFQVVTVSFDPREQPELAAAKKQSYVESYGRPGAAAGWHFLTGQEPAIAALARAVGFRYTYDPKLDQFAHVSGLMVLTPHGTIARYFYGISHPPRDLRLALVEASANQIGSPVDRVLLLCYDYDPATGKYTLMALNLVRLGGGVTLLVLGSFLLLAWRHERRRARRNLATAG